MIFALEPYNWPPDVTRRQTLRDLKLLMLMHEMVEE